MAQVRRVVEHYGEHPRQFGEWFLPADPGAPLVVLVHGGYFRPVWRLDLEEPTALDLAARGFAVWSVEYRTYEFPWPTAMLDVAAAIDLSLAHAASHGVDASRRAILGHSAGGGITLWAASRRSIPSEAPGADAQAQTFDLVVCHAPVACLETGSRDHLGDGAIDTFMGGRPEDVPERYHACDPYALVPDPASRLVLFHGDADDDVPLSQSEQYLQHVRDVGGDGELIVLPGEGHYEILNPGSSVSGARRRLLDQVLRPA